MLSKIWNYFQPINRLHLPFLENEQNIVSLPLKKEEKEKKEEINFIFPLEKKDIYFSNDFNIKKNQDLTCFIEKQGSDFLLNYKFINFVISSEYFSDKKEIDHILAFSNPKENKDKSPIFTKIKKIEYYSSLKDIKTMKNSQIFFLDKNNYLKETFNFYEDKTQYALCWIEALLHKNIKYNVWLSIPQLFYKPILKCVNEHFFGYHVFPNTTFYKKIQIDSILKLSCKEDLENPYIFVHLKRITKIKNLKEFITMYYSMKWNQYLQNYYEEKYAPYKENKENKENKEELLEKNDLLVFYFEKI